MTVLRKLKPPFTMSKPKPCNKVKNPCKICLGPVTQKNGLQCCGACQSWMHYECAHYTPGKIRDIKAGIIKVTCPCPDCATRLPREFRTDIPVNCANEACPANHPPHCDNKGCPINSDSFINGSGIQSKMMSGNQQDNMNQMPSTQWPGTKCGPECKKHQNLPHQQQSNQWPGAACGAECKKHNAPPKQAHPMPMMAFQSSSECSGPPQQQLSDGCPAGCTDEGDAGRNEPIPSFSVVEQMVSTVGLLTKQMNELMCKMKEICRMKGCVPTSRGQPCQQPGPRSKCPKPCYCPGNPRR